MHSAPSPALALFSQRRHQTLVRDVSLAQEEYRVPLFNIFSKLAGDLLKTHRLVWVNVDPFSMFSRSQHSWQVSENRYPSPSVRVVIRPRQVAGVSSFSLIHVFEPSQEMDEWLEYIIPSLRAERARLFLATTSALCLSKRGKQSLIIYIYIYIYQDILFYIYIYIYIQF